MHINAVTRDLDSQRAPLNKQSIRECNHLPLIHSRTLDTMYFRPRTYQHTYTHGSTAMIGLLFLTPTDQGSGNKVMTLTSNKKDPDSLKTAS